MTKEAPTPAEILVTVTLLGLALLVGSVTGVTVGMMLVVLAFAASPLLPISSSSERVYDLFYVVAATVPLLYPEPLPTVFLLLAGTALIRLARMFRLVTPSPLSSDLLRMVGAGVFAAAVIGAEVADLIGESGVAAIFATGLAFLLWFAFEAFWRSSVEVRDTGVGFGYLVSTSVRDVPLFAALGAAGAIFGVVMLHSQWWVAIVVAAVPFSMTISSFKRHGSVRRTYSQTILALARIPEVAGLGLEGHSERTADLAVAIAKDLGLAPHRVLDVHYAALMHDIGRITLTEPSIVERGFTDSDIDRWSSEIIAEAKYLSKAAEIVSMHSQPFRRPGEEADPDLPLESKIVRAASHFDRKVFGEGKRPLEALESLHQGAAYDFDPRVVKSLRLVLARMGVTTV